MAKTVVDTRAIGKSGEVKAKAILEFTGFDVWDGTPHSSFDLVAVKCGIKYLVNVKNTTRGHFVIGMENIRRMADVKDGVPAFLVIDGDEFAMFTLCRCLPSNLHAKSNPNLEELTLSGRIVEKEEYSSWSTPWAKMNAFEKECAV